MNVDYLFPRKQKLMQAMKKARNLKLSSVTLSLKMWYSPILQDRKHRYVFRGVKKYFMLYILDSE